MEELRIDRLEARIDELAGEMRAGFRGVDLRLCKIETRMGMVETRLGLVETRLDQTATKADLRALESRFGIIEARLDQTATKTDLSELRGEMYKSNAELKTWMLATMVTIIGTFLVALFGLHHWSG